MYLKRKGMLRRIEVKNYRSLKYVSQPLQGFHVLIGPNASGKTTFMDVISFMSDIVNEGIDQAIVKRSSNYLDLTFSSEGGDIEFAIEAEIPKAIQKVIGERFDVVRYEIRIGLNEKTDEHNIKEERVLLLNTSLIGDGMKQQILFQEFGPVIRKKYPGKSGEAFQLVVSKAYGGNDNFYDERGRDSKQGWLPSFKLGPKRSALANLPADETRFPVGTWLKGFLSQNIQVFVLDSLKIRKASPPGQSKKFKPDGSNLPWVINELRKDEEQFQRWVAHLQTALPYIKDIDTVEREDDKHRYLRVFYQSGIRVPGWLVSDGTLRLLALTLPAYIRDFSGVYLIEEPENGLHPVAIETAFQSLSSVYNAQIMLASHSPVMLSLVNKEDLLCFSKAPSGEVSIVKGSNHPALQNWKGESNLSVLFASGILG